MFLGSPDFAVPSLRRLASHPELEVRLVITQPDRPAGRGRRLTAPPVKDLAVELGIPCFQPESLRDESDLQVIREVEPDLLIVAAYGEILRRSVLDLAPHGALNVHPSLLPSYRGSAPMRAAILNGDSHTGISIIKLVRKLDAGPVIRQEVVAIEPDEDAAQLADRLALIGADILPTTCIDWIAGAIASVEQDEALMSMTREWTRDDGRIDWTQSASAIQRLIRASQPWPVAWTQFDGEPFRIHRATITEGESIETGAVERRAKQILVGCGAGALELTRVQPAGKRAMDAAGWWNGIRHDRVAFQ